MKHSVPVTILDVRRETVDCVSIGFNIPDSLKSDFAYLPGQYLTLICDVQGEALHRSYSLCSSPLENEWRVAVKKVQGGKFSNYANEKLKAGDTLEIMTPEGKFYPKLDLTNQKSYLLIAAGSGITPILSIAKSILVQETESEIILFFGNQKIENIIFKEELLALKNKYMSRFQIHFLFSKTVLDEELFHGRLTGHKMKQFDKLLYNHERIDEVFICGPEEMIMNVKAGLVDLGVSEDKIHFELFGSNLPIAKMTLDTEMIGKHSQIRLRLDGKIMEFPLEYGTISILDAALAQKANLPYACKGGVCCTCKARLLEGEVKMTVNYGLEKDELSAGYILTCQSFPSTDNISIDFD